MKRKKSDPAQYVAANEASSHHASFGRTSEITNTRMPPLQICGHYRARPKSNAVLSTHRPHPVTLHFAHYNLVCVHKTLRVTPAMAANVTDRPRSLEELVERTSQ